MVLRKLGVAAMVAATTAMLAGVPAAAEVKLRVFEWEGYTSMHKEAFEAAAKAQGKDIVLELVKKPDGSPRYILSYDDIIEVLDAGGADIVTPTVNYYHQEQARLLKLLAPVDTARLANYGAVYASIRGLDAFQDGSGAIFGVPYVGGSYALAYNAEKADRPASWTVLLKPEAKGTFQITDEQFEANVYQAAILAGVPSDAVFDHAKMTPDQRAKTQEILNTLAANSAGFWSGVMPSVDDMKNLKYVTDYWFGVTAANAAGQRWRIATTSEPASLWLDAVSIAKPVANDPAKMEAAHMLIDYMIGVEAQIKVLETFGAVIFNGKAFAQVGGGIDPETYFKPDLFWRPLSTETRAAFREMWNTAVKAAGK